MRVNPYQAARLITLLFVVFVAIMLYRQLTAPEVGQVQAPTVDVDIETVAPPPEPQADNEDVVNVVRNLHLAEVIGRIDLLQRALKQLRAIAPAHPEVNFFEGYRLLYAGNDAAAREVLQNFQERYPENRRAAQLASYIDSETTRKDELQQARLFATAGRYSQALTAYDQLFPHGRPTLSLELEYLRFQANVDGSWQKTLDALEALNREYPDFPPVRLALADHLFRGDSQVRRAEAIYRELAFGPGIGRQAADSWLRVLGAKEISAAVLADYAELASRYPNDLDIQENYKRAQADLSEERRRLRNPHYRAKKRGLAQLEKNRIEAAKQSLLYALEEFSEDEEVLGGLGMVYLRMGQQAEAEHYFQLALKHNRNPDLVSKWRSLSRTSGYWAKVKRADELIVAGDYPQAELLLNQAVSINPSAPQAYRYLAELATARGQREQADRHYRQALSVDPLYRAALWGRVALRRDAGDTSGALQLALSYNRRQQAVIAEELHQWRLERILVELEQAVEQGDRARVLESVTRALSHQPRSPWDRSDIAEALVSVGELERADTLMRAWVEGDTSAEMQFAYALYLSGREQADRAIAVLEGVPEDKRSQSMRDNLERLRFDRELASLGDESGNAQIELLESLQTRYRDDPDMLIRLARRWLQLGEKPEAVDIAAALEPSPSWSDARHLAYGELLLALGDEKAFADWYAMTFERPFGGDALVQRRAFYAEYLVLRAQKAEQRGDHEVAYAFYSQSASEPGRHQLDAQLGVLRNARVLGEDAIFQNTRESLLGASEQRTVGELTTIAASFHQLGESDQARALLSQIEQRSDATPLELRDATRLAEQMEAWQATEALALKTLDRELGPTPREPSARYLAADRNWLTRSARATLDRVYARNDGHIIIGFDHSVREGQETTLQVPIELRYPVPAWDGHLIARLDYVNLDSGDVDYIDRISATPLATQRIEFSEETTGVALGIGWQAQDWWVDVGTTPLGFGQKTWVGGIGTRGDIGQVGWRLNLSRRPEVGTTLSYAGMEVPAGASRSVGTEWGGVVRTGLKLNLSYDRGGALGYWGSLQAHQLTGVKVEDNQRLAALGGVYWRAYESEPHNWRFGVNLMHLRYDKNLELRALTHGGYFSPQNYWSVSLPVRYFGRRGRDFSYLLGASIGQSWKTEDVPFGFGSGSSRGGGFGYSLEAAVEKRVSDHWYVGAAADIQRADFYEPNHFLLYLRYTFQDRWQPVPKPPEPPIPYSAFD